jgi:hypothetical protein
MTISPNYSGEVFEIPDREVLVVFANVPPQDGEIDEQRIERENANATRATPRQQELAAAASAIGQHAGNVGQGASNQPAGNIGPHEPTAPVAPQQRNEPHRNCLHLQETS